MKKILLILIIILFGVKTNTYSQIVLNKTSDIDVLLQNKAQFINHPFSFLLNNIHLEIKKVRAFAAVATLGQQNGEFHLFFVDNNEYDSLYKLKKIAPNIIVVVEEDFVWKPKQGSWNSIDTEKYGSLTVLDIRKF